MRLNFVKMQGLGNDFILIDCITQKINCSRIDFKELSKKLCDRRYGIGADQILLLEKTKNSDFKMRIFNADGSEVEMCGNGIRCLAKYIWDNKLSNKRVLNIETLAGIIKPEKTGSMVKVDMGKPVFRPELIPVNLKKWVVRDKDKGLSKYKGEEVVLDRPLKINSKVFKITCVSMGNPHAVIYVENLEDFPVKDYGPIIENHPVFPKRINVEFVKVLSYDEIKMRVWERGAGETLACGTGACASMVSSYIKGKVGKKTKVYLLGGELLIEWGDDEHVYMTGPAIKVFNGHINI